MRLSAESFSLSTPMTITINISGQKIVRNMDKNVTHTTSETAAKALAMVRFLIDLGPKLAKDIDATPDVISRIMPIPNKMESTT